MNLEQLINRIFVEHDIMSQDAQAATSNALEIVFETLWTTQAVRRQSRKEALFPISLALELTFKPQPSALQQGQGQLAISNVSS